MFHTGFDLVTGLPTRQNQQMHATTSFRHPSPIKPLHAATYVVTGNTLMESLMLPMIEGPKLTDPWGLRSVQYFYRLGAETLVWIYLNTHISLLSITPAPSACFVPVSTKIRERWVPEGWWGKRLTESGACSLGGQFKASWRQNVAMKIQCVVQVHSQEKIEWGVQRLSIDFLKQVWKSHQEMRRRTGTLYLPYEQVTINIVSTEPCVPFSLEIICNI